MIKINGLWVIVCLVLVFVIGELVDNLLIALLVALLYIFTNMIYVWNNEWDKKASNWYWSFTTKQKEKE